MDWHIERLESCDSTQDEARKRAQGGASHGTVVLAKTMADGRGQHGRGWHAPEGGLYLSLVLRGLQNPRFATLALGNAVADVVEVAGAEPGLKWVNDVWIERRKVAGVLVEAEYTGDELDFMVAGIGLNVNGSAKAWGTPLSESAITLEDALGAENCMEDVETYLLEAVDGWLQKLQAGRVEDVLAAWRARDALHGAQIGVDPEGDVCAKLVGHAAGIDDDGRLLLDVDGEVQAIESGAVFPMN